MATHSSILAWEIPWIEESTIHGVTRVRHNLATKPPLPAGGLRKVIFLRHLFDLMKAKIKSFYFYIKNIRSI